MSVTSKAALPLLVAASLLAGCATHSDGSAPLNQRTWPICSLLGGAVNTFELNLSSGQLKYPDGRNPALDDDPTARAARAAPSRPKTAP